MLAFQNSKNGHNLGLEITPEMFRPLFRLDISSTIDSTWLEGLKRRFERFFEKVVFIEVLAFLKTLTLHKRRQTGFSQALIGWRGINMYVPD